MSPDTGRAEPPKGLLPALGRWMKIRIPLPRPLRRLPRGIGRRTATARKAAEEVSEFLEGFIGELESVCNGSEPHFIRLGKELESIHAEAGALAGETLRTLQCIGGGSDDEGVLIKLDRLVRACFSDIEARYADVGDNLDHIGTMIEYLDQLSRICAVIEKIAMILKVVGFNIRVESARTQASSDLFTVVSHQINELSSRVVRIATRIRDDVRSTGSRQQAIHKRITGGLHQLDRLTEETRRAVDGYVKEIEDLMERSLDVMASADAHSREISRQVGEVVVGIQIHDSMSQRVTHIINALKDVRWMLDGSAEKATDRASDLISHEDVNPLDAAYAILLLQAAQLKQTLTEVRDVHRNTGGAFARIGEQVHLLAEGLSVLESASPKGEGGAPEQADDPFVTLQSELTAVGGLIEEAAALVENVQKTAEEASETAEKLTTLIHQVEEIGFDTHLIALNAIVKAAHLDSSGSSLEVLAQEVKRLSDSSNTFVVKVRELLEGLRSPVQELREGEMGNGDGEALEEAALQQGMERITDAYARFREGSSVAFQRAGTLKERLSRIITGLDFLPDLSAELSGLHDRLAASAGQLTPWIGGDVQRSVSETRRLAQRYTMQQERGVHHTLFQLEGYGDAPDEDPAAPEAGEKSPAPESDDLGDNVELF